MYNFSSLCRRNNRLFFHRCIRSQLFCGSRDVNLSRRRTPRAGWSYIWSI